MLFTQITGNNNIIQDVTEPVNEGWGTMFLQIFAQVNPFPASFITNKIPMILSKTNMKRILKNDVLQKYLKTQCDILFKAEHKKDSTVSHTFPPGLLHTLRENIYAQYQAGSLLDHGKYWNQSTLNNEFLEGVFNNYTVIIFFDMKHIQSIRVVFYSKAKDEYYDKFIPSPRSLKKLGFYKEKVI
jgi:hypothetical protein